MESAIRENQSLDITAAAQFVDPITSVTVLAAPEATEGRIALFETRERRGAGPPLHRHSHEDELVFVLDGQVTFHVANGRIEGTPGTCAVLPRGSEHGYVIESDEARLLIVLAPAERGFEGCVGNMSRCASEPVPGQERTADQDIEPLVATAARYGVEITGPRPDDAEGGTSR